MSEETGQTPAKGRGDYNPPRDYYKEWDLRLGGERPPVKESLDAEWHRIKAEQAAAERQATQDQLDEEEDEEFEPEEVPDDAVWTPNTDTKATNPKEAFGDAKLPLHLVPDSFICYVAIAMLEGALKYGSSNWAASGVKVTTYLSAIERHYRKFKSGENADPTTQVPHLASISACCAILLDANIRGKIVDDRAPHSATPQLIDELAGNVAHLKDLFAGRDPHHYTHNDFPRS